jgi:hypothetical protein
MFLADLLYPDNSKRQLNLRTKIIRLQTLLTQLKASWQELEMLARKDNDPLQKLDNTLSLHSMAEALKSQFQTGNEKAHNWDGIFDNDFSIKDFTIRKLVGASVGGAAGEVVASLLPKLLTTNLLVLNFCQTPVTLLLTDLVLDAYFGHIERAKLEAANAEIDDILRSVEPPLEELHKRLEATLYYWRNGLVRLPNGDTFKKTNNGYVKIQPS